MKIMCYSDGKYKIIIPTEIAERVLQVQNGTEMDWIVEVIDGVPVLMVWKQGSKPISIQQIEKH